jgi:hypothetical protein
MRTQWRACKSEDQRCRRSLVPRSGEHASPVGDHGLHETQGKPALPFVKFDSGAYQFIDMLLLDEI